MKTEEFVKLMTGHFDNAQHVNTVCNDKINNIPEDFHGIFIVEDKNTFSWYNAGVNFSDFFSLL